MDDTSIPPAPPVGAYGLPRSAEGAGEVILSTARGLTGELIGMILEGGDPTMVVEEVATTLIPSREGQQQAMEAARPKPQMDLIIRHMLVNPTATVAQVAHHFGVRTPWMYTVVNSDFFRVKYNALLKELDVEHLLPTLHQRIVGMAHQSLAKLETVIETASPELSLEIYKAMAKTVAPPPTGPTVNFNQNNQVNLSIDARSASITAARRNMLQNAQKMIENG